MYDIMGIHIFQEHALFLSLIVLINKIINVACNEVLQRGNYHIVK
jgi:hypothetical protein